jgi:hypothetical protein
MEAMARAVSSGWTCEICRVSRIRTVVIDVPLATDMTGGDDLQTRCPACGAPDQVLLPEADEKVISVRYIVP